MTDGRPTTRGLGTEGLRTLFFVLIGSFPFASTIEDLPKLLGITAWVYFFFRATLEVVTDTHSSSNAPPQEA